MQMLMHLMLSQCSLRLSSFRFILFSFFCSISVISCSLSSISLIHSFASWILLLIPSGVFFILVILFFISLFFKTYISLLNISYNFSTFASVPAHPPPTEILDHLYFITLNSFSCRLPISISLNCSSGVLSCFFIWSVFLCHFILSSFLLWSFLKAAKL